MRIITALVVLLGFLPCSAFAQGEEQVPELVEIEPPVQFFFSSAVGAPDLQEMFTENENPSFVWDEALKSIAGFAFVQGQLEASPNPDWVFLLRGNSFNRLTDLNVFRTISQNPRYKKYIDVQADGIKPHHCPPTVGKVTQSVNEAIGAGWRIYLNEGQVYSYTPENSLGNCHLRPGDMARVMSQWFSRVTRGLKANVDYSRSQLIPERDKPMLAYIEPHLGVIESYPFNPIRDHEQYMIALRMKLQSYGLTLDSYTLDIDIVKALEEKWDVTGEVGRFAALCKSLGIKFGLIINGEDSKSLSTDNDVWYIDTALTRLVNFDQLGILRLAQLVYVQSWSNRSTPEGQKLKYKDMPANLPDGRRYAHLHFLRHVVACFYGKEACESY